MVWTTDLRGGRRVRYHSVTVAPQIPDSRIWLLQNKLYAINQSICIIIWVFNRGDLDCRSGSLFYTGDMSNEVINRTCWVFSDKKKNKKNWKGFVKLINDELCHFLFITAFVVIFFHEISAQSRSHSIDRSRLLLWFIPTCFEYSHYKHTSESIRTVPIYIMLQICSRLLFF